LLRLIEEQHTVERYDLEMRQPSGDPVYVVARFVGVFGEEGELIELQGYLFNDTKRRRLEQQLVQSQKMEGLGTLAGGIAHDFNNILTIILGYTTQLEKRPGQIPAAIKVIKEAVERGAALVQQLLTSARQAEAQFSVLDLNALVAELERMLQATFPKMIDFDLRLTPNFPLITADRSQIHQVLLNLCVNARDAMPNGGTITVETLLTTGEELKHSFTGADAHRYACIRVHDTGSGMTPEVKAHIFEPFFTTKERAKGTGLGLSVVYGVVNNHRGFVQVESEPNVGTTFSVHLPILHSQEQAAGTSRHTPIHTGHPQTILLVEDEEMLRELGVEVLQAEGYRVLIARDGLEALEVFTANRDEIGLVVCDLGLPKLGGRDVFLRMKEIRPSVRAIVASGYLEPSMRSEILKAGVIDTIQKPYDLQELIGKIQTVIGKAESEDDHPQLF
jgi:signal transduction histidine kinase/ActR/RegA family two-component response regulator